MRFRTLGALRSVALSTFRLFRLDSFSLGASKVSQPARDTMLNRAGRAIACASMRKVRAPKGKMPANGWAG